MRKMIVLFLILYFVNDGTAHILSDQIGFKIGMSNSSLAISEDEAEPFLGYESQWLIRHNLPGFQFGLFKNFDLSENVQLQAEIFYAQRGVDASTEYLFDDVDYKVRLDYIEIPATFKYNFPVTTSISAGVSAGPYGAIKINAKRHSRIDGVSESIKLENVRDFDYGLVLGLFSDVVLRDSNLVLELRYNHGLPNIMTPLQNIARISDKQGTVKNRSFIIFMGVRL